MEKIEILISNQASNYLDDLIEILYKKDYFGFLESAEEYISSIYEFIYSSINTFPSKETPSQIRFLGSKYLFFKTKSRTTWYIFFENKKLTYVVTHICNNNCEEVKWI
ncbi:MAG: hypothetical protein H7239_11610 [Flavobacterium sp.]|nr:hypothetical protein [Flavobacterium sp.]